jgi:hypothetical protein
MIRYTLTDSKIEIDYGLIARTTRNIPLAKIQDVTVSASIPNVFSDSAMLWLITRVRLAARQSYTTSTLRGIMPTCFCASCGAGIKLKSEPSRRNCFD